MDTLKGWALLALGFALGQAGHNGGPLALYVELASLGLCILALCFFLKSIIALSKKS